MPGSTQNHRQTQTVPLSLSPSLQDLPPPVGDQEGLLIVLRAGQHGILAEVAAQVLRPERGGGGEPGAPAGADRPAGQNLPGVVQTQQDGGEGDGVGEREVGPVRRWRHL